MTRSEFFKVIISAAIPPLVTALASAIATFFFAERHYRRKGREEGRLEAEEEFKLRRNLW